MFGTVVLISVTNAFAAGDAVCVATKGNDRNVLVFMVVKLASYVRAYPARNTSLLLPVRRPVTPLPLVWGVQAIPTLGIQLFVSLLGDSNLNAGSLLFAASMR